MNYIVYRSETQPNLGGSSDDQSHRLKLANWTNEWTRHIVDTMVINSHWYRVSLPARCVSVVSVSVSVWLVWVCECVVNAVACLWSVCQFVCLSFPKNNSVNFSSSPSMPLSLSFSPSHSPSLFHLSTTRQNVINHIIIRQPWSGQSKNKNKTQKLTYCPSFCSTICANILKLNQHFIPWYSPSIL